MFNNEVGSPTHFALTSALSKARLNKAPQLLALIISTVFLSPRQEVNFSVSGSIYSRVPLFHESIANITYLTFVIMDFSQRKQVMAQLFQYYQIFPSFFFFGEQRRTIGQTQTVGKYSRLSTTILKYVPLRFHFIRRNLHISRPRLPGTANPPYHKRKPHGVNHAFACIKRGDVFVSALMFHFSPLRQKGKSAKC